MDKLTNTCPRLDTYGRQLLDRFLEVEPLNIFQHAILTFSFKYDTTKRISAKNALNHETFRPFGENVYKLKDGKV